MARWHPGKRQVRETNAIALQREWRLAQMRQARQEGRLKIFVDFSPAELAELAAKVTRWKAAGTCRVGSR